MGGPRPEQVLDARLSVAPMMAWTDRHCRAFHRVLSTHTVLYTEMVTAMALVRGGALHLIDAGCAAGPVVLQIGGSDPAELAQATRIGFEHGYNEVNLNVGCPSDKVQSGTFGAVLMKTPDLVAECVAAMVDAASGPVSVKCRIGVDDQNPTEILPDFLDKMQSAGAANVTVHARKAWLKGLSPKENRDVPPLDYALVHQMVTAFPDLSIGINGGIDRVEQVPAHLRQGCAGVMIGRAAYHAPYDILAQADALIYGQDSHPISRHDVMDRMFPYIDQHLMAGGQVTQVTRHMLGLFAGATGARVWRRRMTEDLRDASDPIQVIQNILTEIPHSDVTLQKVS